jgi:HEAT repeat protein
MHWLDSARKEIQIHGLKELVAALDDPDAQVRCAAAQALQERADPAHLPQFLTLLEDEHFGLRLTAIQYLRRISNPAIAQALVAHLADSDSDVRVAAAQALGSVRDLAVLEPLILSLADEEPAVRHAAAAALEEIDPRWVRHDAVQRAIPRLEALRADPQPWIAAAAEKALQKIRAANYSSTEFWKRESGIRKL